MSQENPSTYRTLEAIKAQYPPQEEIFKFPAKDGGEDALTSQISRNEDGVILYVVPGSTKLIERSPKPDPTV